MTETTAQKLTSLQDQLDDLTTPDREWVAVGLKQLGKLELANRARKMIDNQKVLNTNVETDRAYKSLGAEIAKWNFERVKGQAGAPPAGESPVDGKTNGIAFPDDSEMDIRIDSPTTINHQYPAAPVPAPVQQTIQQPAAIVKKGLGSLATAAIVASSIGTGAAATYFMTSPDTPPAVVAPADGKDFLLNLMPPDPPKKTP